MYIPKGTINKTLAISRKHLGTSVSFKLVQGNQDSSGNQRNGIEKRFPPFSSQTGRYHVFIGVDLSSTTEGAIRFGLWRCDYLLCLIDTIHLSLEYFI